MLTPCHCQAIIHSSTAEQASQRSSERTAANDRK